MCWAFQTGLQQTASPNASVLRRFNVTKIGFIGAGQMATALASGIAKLKGKTVSFSISDPSDAACQSFTQKVAESSPVERCKSNQDLVDQSEVIFLVVKPQFVVAALEDVNFETSSPLVVSVVAGLRISQLERLTSIKRIVRVMPNTPCLIGQGASAIAHDDVEDSDVEVVMGFLTSVGNVVKVEDRLMDSVTGLSGSGPAYVFTFIEALIDGAVLTGMPRSTARELAIQTVIGAALMVDQTGEHPAVLKDCVTSPGGTTIAGLKALEESSFRDAVMSAVVAATERSMDLGD